MKKRIADIVVETLIENGITDAFSVVGGGAMHLNNAFALKKCHGSGKLCKADRKTGGSLCHQRTGRTEYLKWCAGGLGG